MFQIVCFIWYAVSTSTLQYLEFGSEIEERGGLKNERLETIRDDANSSWQLIRTIIRLSSGETVRGSLSFTLTNSQMKTQVWAQVSITPALRKTDGLFTCISYQLATKKL